MSALAIPVPSHPVRGTRPVRHLQLVGPDFVPAERAPRPVPAARPAVRSAVRLTARGRLVRSVLLLVVALSVAVAGGAWAGGLASGSGAYSGPVEHVSVGAGDTVWAIAAATAAEGQDVRDLVDEILSLNNLGSGQLVVGQQLVVPAG